MLIDLVTRSYDTNNTCNTLITFKCKLYLQYLQETCLTGPLGYKNRVIFVLVLSVICPLRGAVG